MTIHSAALRNVSNTLKNDVFRTVEKQFPTAINQHPTTVTISVISKQAINPSLSVRIQTTKRVSSGISKSAWYDIYITYAYLWIEKINQMLIDASNIRESFENTSSLGDLLMSLNRVNNTNQHLINTDK